MITFKMAVSERENAAGTRNWARQLWCCYCCCSLCFRHVLVLKNIHKTLNP